MARNVVLDVVEGNIKVNSSKRGITTPNIRGGAKLPAPGSVPVHEGWVNTRVNTTEETSS